MVVAFTRPYILASDNICEGSTYFGMTLLMLLQHAPEGWLSDTLSVLAIGLPGLCLVYYTWQAMCATAVEEIEVMEFVKLFENTATPFDNMADGASEQLLPPDER